MFSSSEEVLAYIKNEGVEFIDIRFTDLPGVQQHFNVPASNFNEDSFTEGQMFDGSSIRGFASIDKSDLKLIPDPATAYVDPFRKAQDAEHQPLDLRAAHRRAVRPRPAPGGHQGRGVPARRPASPTPSTSAPRPSSTSSTTSGSRRR